MRIYLVRHAVAEELGEEMRFADAQRSLTAKGRRRFRRNARAFARLGENVQLVCTSPLVRAVQTAELLAAALGHDQVVVLDELRSDAAVEPLLRRIATFDVGSLALVGHKRLLCDLAVTLANVPLEDALRLRLKRGAIARIDVRNLAKDARGKPRWWLGPQGETIQNGLPLH